jgi:hypothetical protein
MGVRISFHGDLAADTIVAWQRKSAYGIYVGVSGTPFGVHLFPSREQTEQIVRKFAEVLGWTIEVPKEMPVEAIEKKV